MAKSENESLSGDDSQAWVFESDTLDTPGTDDKRLPRPLRGEGVGSHSESRPDPVKRTITPSLVPQPVASRQHHVLGEPVALSAVSAHSPESLSGIDFAPPSSAIHHNAFRHAKKPSKSVPHLNRHGKRCHCTFYRPSERTGGHRTASKLDWLKERPDFQKPEKQPLLKLFEREVRESGDKVDPLLPWLAREVKKKRLHHQVGGQYGHLRSRRQLAEDEEPELYTTYLDTPYGKVEDKPVSSGEIAHLADWYQSHHESREGLDIMKHTWPEVQDKVKEWDKHLAEQQEQADLEKGKGGEVVHKFDDDWTVRKLTDPEDLDFEGDTMGHCVGTYGYDEACARGDKQIYSLRGPDNKPHVTMELNSKNYEPVTDEDVLNAAGEHRDLRTIAEKSPEVYEQLLDKVLQYHHYMQGKTDTDPGDVPGHIQDVGELWSEVANRIHKKPLPHGANIVQIQGNGNTIPKKEYQARMKDWLATIPEEDRPYWDGEAIDDPDDMPEYRNDDEGGHYDDGGYGPHGDYGVKVKNDYDYGSILDRLDYEQDSRGAASWHSGGGPYDQRSYDPEEVADNLYLTALQRGEIDKFAEGAQNTAQKHQDNYDEYRDMNYEYTIPPPQGDEEYPIELGGMTIEDEEEHEKAADDDETHWQEQHPGMGFASHLYRLINPHFGPYSDPAKAPMGVNNEPAKNGYQNEFFSDPREQAQDPQNRWTRFKHPGQRDYEIQQGVQQQGVLSNVNLVEATEADGEHWRFIEVDDDARMTNGALSPEVRAKEEIAVKPVIKAQVIPILEPRNGMSADRRSTHSTRHLAPVDNGDRSVEKRLAHAKDARSKSAILNRREADNGPSYRNQQQQVGEGSIKYSTNHSVGYVSKDELEGEAHEGRAEGVWVFSTEGAHSPLLPVAKSTSMDNPLRRSVLDRQPTSTTEAVNGVVAVNASERSFRHRYLAAANRAIRNGDPLPPVRDGEFDEVVPVFAHPTDVGTLGVPGTPERLALGTSGDPSVVPGVRLGDRVVKHVTTKGMADDALASDDSTHLTSLSHSDLHHEEASEVETDDWSVLPDEPALFAHGGSVSVTRQRSLSAHHVIASDPTFVASSHSDLHTNDRELEAQGSGPTRETLPVEYLGGVLNASNGDIAEDAIPFDARTPTGVVLGVRTGDVNSEHSASKFTPWTPGSYGKGIVGPDHVQTWNTDEYGSPHHGDVTHPLNPDTPIYIEPNGFVGVHSEWEDLADQEHVKSMLQQHHPELKFATDDEWMRHFVGSNLSSDSKWYPLDQAQNGQTNLSKVEQNSDLKAMEAEGEGKHWLFGVGKTIDVGLRDFEDFVFADEAILHQVHQGFVTEGGFSTHSDQQSLVEQGHDHPQRSNAKRDVHAMHSTTPILAADVGPCYYCKGTGKHPEPSEWSSTDRCPECLGSGKDEYAIFEQEQAKTWEPGEWGKGYIDGDKLRTWNVERGEFPGSIINGPHHKEMGMSGKGLALYINPDGQVTTRDQQMDEANLDDAQLKAHHPQLHVNRWTFGSHVDDVDGEANDIEQGTGAAAVVEASGVSVRDQEPSHGRKQFGAGQGGTFSGLDFGSADVTDVVHNSHFENDRRSYAEIDEWLVSTGGAKEHIASSENAAETASVSVAGLRPSALTAVASGGGIGIGASGTGWAFGSELGSGHDSRISVDYWNPMGIQEMPKGMPRPVMDMGEHGTRPVPWTQDDAVPGKPDHDRLVDAQAQDLCLLCGEPVTRGVIIITPASYAEFEHSYQFLPMRERLELAIDKAPLHDRCATMTLAHCPHLKGFYTVPYESDQKGTR